MKLKIFPAWITPEGNKVPIFEGWQKAATDDPLVIEGWRQHYSSLGERFIWGIPCGQTNGIYALDIDSKIDPKTGKTGWDSIKELISQGKVLPETVSQWTRTKGAHFIFKYDPNLNLRNSVKFLPGLDTRSEGGWIADYGLNFDRPLAEIPSWIVELTKREERIQPLDGEIYLIDPKTAMEILEKCCDAVRYAPPQEANNILNIKSYEVGQLIPGKGLSREFAEQELFKAGKDRGKADYEIKATMKSGLESGMKNPLRCPFKTVPVIQGLSSETPIIEKWTPRKMTMFDLKNTSKLKKPQLHKDWSSEDITIVTADGGTGKSTLEMEEAICLALGEPFLGFQNVQQGKTLFITGEDTSEKLAAVCGAILRQRGLFESNPENDAKVQTVLDSIFIKKDPDLCLITKDKQGFLVPSKDALDRIMEAVDEINPKKIVFDPIAMFWGPESGLNDMAKAVSKSFNRLQERSNAQIVAINHMGKISSSTKDMTQFAGRGGTGLPSHSRISRVLRGLDEDEYLEIMGKPLDPGETAMLCQVNKFSDGSPLYNKPFVIVRNGYRFVRPLMPIASDKKLEDNLTIAEKIMTFVKDIRSKNMYPTKSAIVGHFVLSKSPIQQTKINLALTLLTLQGHLGEKLEMIRNPDENNSEKAYIVVDFETGKEI